MGNERRFPKLDGQDLNEFIAYASKHPGVTFMRKKDIADWWYKRYGNEKPAMPFLLDM